MQSPSRDGGTCLYADEHPHCSSVHVFILWRWRKNCLFCFVLRLQRDWTNRSATETRGDWDVWNGFITLIKTISNIFSSLQLPRPAAVLEVGWRRRWGHWAAGGSGRERCGILTNLCFPSNKRTDVPPDSACPFHTGPVLIVWIASLPCFNPLMKQTAF